MILAKTEKAKLSPGSKIPPTITAIQAILDRFGMLEKYQRLYGEIFYTPKSSLFPPYATFSNSLRTK